MPELRKDPIVGRWVIVAEQRAKRPGAFVERSAPPSGPCPFCEGHESETPAEVSAARRADSRPDSRGWRVRVVPNKFPALVLEGEADARRQGMYDVMEGVGAHEVIIESPRHVRSTSELPLEDVCEVLWTYRERLAEFKRDGRLKYGMLFKNVGAAAGATLEHIHSQLIVMPMVPNHAQEEIVGAKDYFDRHGRCVFCDMIEQELAQRKRIVIETPDFVVFCPFASRFTYEAWLLPKFHASHYEDISRTQADAAADALRQVITKIDTALDRPAYNYLIHTAPFDCQELAHYHWHVEIMPRLTGIAGFEWGSGLHINPVPPEEAAAKLR
jgi:UDPglucose--hexose-1-phosphate uridylyltransferase